MSNVYIDALAGTSWLSVAGDNHLGAGKFSGAAGEVHYKVFHIPADTWHDHTLVEADTNGDRRADLQIEFRGVHTFTSADFVL